MKTKKLIYECDNCGACCKHFDVPVYPEDFILEPRLKRIPLVTFSGVDKKFLNNSGENEGCSLLTKSNLCFIYETRPKCCKNFEVGGLLCQWARGKSNLPMLRSKQLK